MTDYIHGSARIKIDGDNQIVDIAAKLKIGGRVNSVKMVGEKSFPSKKTILSEIEMKIPHTGDVDLIQEQIRAGVEVQFQSDNGATYVVPITSQTGELDTGEEGLVGLTYMGDPAVKL
ncbi:MAG: phage tail tube protein [Gammaproteobacteria bacterium]|nr:phage tail tube protein [Gammaproteobacteria bacterium]